MKKFYLFLPILLIVVPRISSSADDNYVDDFINGIYKEMSLYEQQGDLALYEKEVWSIADNFIIHLLSDKIKETDLFESFKKIQNNDKVSYSLQMNYNCAGIGYSFVTRVGEEEYAQDFGITIYNISVKKTKAYFVYYDHHKRIDRGAVDPHDGPDCRSIRTFRIIQYNRKKGGFEVIARFEDTNVYHYNGDFVFAAPSGDVVSPKQLSGDLSGSEFIKREDGSIVFQTAGGVLPDAKGIIPGRGANHWIAYRIKWILTPQNKLYAEEILWDYKREFEDENLNPVLRPKVIKLDSGQ